ncbi:tRNA lysidine(34) synthetase TilS [Microbulbifer halophilus]|uniref:tRNA(Ile)-lysidine synthase n=1 Tax=Microbulbifer halophilus TaxID=453963 RepID=A0ABW5EFV2_9GAMM|nr:tRNA lysidine(34) synthetase TilS [Microbulbifer halophilus]MCW8127812.1 tRNA lysidine(34) synthetase TilS [Microbulbifer halophilus]
MSGLLTEIVEGVLARYPCAGERWIAYSGGLDSTALLHLLADAGLPLRAVHIHHGLAAEADAWQAHCQRTASALDIPLTAVRVSVDPRDGGLEQAARRARYGAFQEILQPGDQLLLAQHGDDQVETFLLRLLRGAGAPGLAAMAESRPLGAGSLLRPLLGVGRGELEDYARERGLHWIEDPSNDDQRLERNYLRARVLPPLRKRWPVRERVVRAADNLGEAASLLRDLGEADLSACDRRRERFGESVDLDKLQRLSRRRRKNLLRNWLAGLGGGAPEAPHLEEALDQLAGAASDSVPAVRIGSRVLRRFRNRAHLTPQLPAEPAGGGWTWRGDTPLDLGGGWTLAPGPDWPAGDYRVRFRRGGERAGPVQRGHSQSLKKLLQEWALEPWLRDRVPLVFRAGEPDRPLAVGDLFVCEKDFPGTLEWCHPEPGSAIRD